MDLMALTKVHHITASSIAVKSCTHMEDLDETCTRDRRVHIFNHFLCEKNTTFLKSNFGV